MVFVSMAYSDRSTMQLNLRHLILLVMLGMLASCNSPGSNDAVRIVGEWQGKEVTFPHNPIFTIYGQDTVDFNFQEADYKVVSYVDSVGCVSCKLQLDRWKDIIHRIDSVSDVRVPFVFVFSPEKLRDVMYATKSGGFDYPILLDLKGEFNALNHFPDNFNFQTMLLDKDNKVLAIGNPVQNPKIIDLYQAIILGIEGDPKPNVTLTEANIDQTDIDFGKLNLGNKQERTLKLTNTGNKPLIVQDVVLSCGCTKVDYPKAPIMPGETGEVTVSYDPDKKGGFHKTVTLYCNAKQSPLRITISGKVE